jgi:hypothetical protein
MLTVVAGAGGMALTAGPAQAHLSGATCRKISQAPGHSFGLETEADEETAAPWACAYTPVGLTQTYVANAPTGWEIIAYTPTSRRVLASGTTPASGTVTLRPGESVELQINATCEKTGLPVVTIPATGISVDARSACAHAGFVLAGS